MSSIPLPDKLSVMLEPSADARIMANAIFDRYLAFSQAGFSSAQAFHLTVLYMQASVYYEDFEE
jgi:hypothetical protein